jgi:hypothetical protein
LPHTTWPLMQNRKAGAFSGTPTDSRILTGNSEGKLEFQALAPASKLRRTGTKQLRLSRNGAITTADGNK